MNVASGARDFARSTADETRSSSCHVLEPQLALFAARELDEVGDE